MLYQEDCATFVHYLDNMCQPHVGYIAAVFPG